MPFKDKEHEREYKRLWAARWREANREKQRAIRRERHHLPITKLWRLKNRDRINALARARYVESIQKMRNRAARRRDYDAIKIKMINARYEKRQMAEIGRSYAVRLLRRSMDISVRYMPTELIEAKQAHLKFIRLLKEKTNGS